VGAWVLPPLTAYRQRNYGRLHSCFFPQHNYTATSTPQKASCKQYYICSITDFTYQNHEIFLKAGKIEANSKFRVIGLKLQNKSFFSLRNAICVGSHRNGSLRSIYRSIDPGKNKCKPSLRQKTTYKHGDPLRHRILCMGWGWRQCGGH
jgi:hypothetical protein